MVVNESEMLQMPLLNELIKEADELTAIFASTDKTAKLKRNKN